MALSVEKMRDTLLSECMGMFDVVHESGKKFSAFGKPPVLITIDILIKKDDGNVIKEAYAYSEDGLKPISISHEDSEDSWEESGMYYREAAASASYDGDGKASISVTFGPLFGRGYSYDVIEDRDKYRLTNQQMIWIS